MNCRQAQHLLDSYLDGELPVSLRAEVHAHRLTCPDCQRAMAIVEVAGDVIGSDRPEPLMSLSFTDRVLSAVRPPEEARVQRIVRFRRAAAFFGPIVSAAALWMFVVSYASLVESVPTPRPLTDRDVVAVPRVAAAVDVAKEAPGSATIVDTLARGLLSPAMATWRDTQRSTRDLLSLGRWVFSSAGEPLGAPSPADGDETDSGVLTQAESMLMDLLAPQNTADTVTESPDVL